MYLLPVYLLSLSIEFPTMWILISLALVKDLSYSSSEGLQLLYPLQRTPCFDQSKRAIFLIGCD
jgi:hypothetical protein